MSDPKASPFYGMYDDNMSVEPEPTGIGNHRSVSRYTEQAYAINNTCMTSAQRARLLTQAANKELETEGVPAPALHNLHDRDGSLGSFENAKNKWDMNIDYRRMTDKAVLNPAKAADAANTIYHESRHAEQAYRIARMRAGLGESPAQTSDSTLIPIKVAKRAAADPILQCDRAEHEAEVWDASSNGPGRAYSDEVEAHTDTRKHEYCQLPEEADAWGIGAKVTQAYPNGIDRRQLQLCE